MARSEEPLQGGLATTVDRTGGLGANGLDICRLVTPWSQTLCNNPVKSVIGRPRRIAFGLVSMPLRHPATPAGTPDVGVRMTRREHVASGNAARSAGSLGVEVGFPPAPPPIRVTATAEDTFRTREPYQRPDRDRTGRIAVASFPQVEQPRWHRRASDGISRNEGSQSSKTRHPNPTSTQSSSTQTSTQRRIIGEYWLIPAGRREYRGGRKAHNHGQFETPRD